MTKKNQHIPSGYKPSPLGIIPEDWEVKKLGEVCTFLDSQRIPIKDADRGKMQGQYPYYGASGIIDYVNNYIFDDDLILLGEDGANIITRSTPLAFLVSGKVWINNHAHVLKTNKGYNRYYICNYLESLSYEKYNTGTAQPKLNQEVCEKIPVLVPSEEEQNRISNLLTLWDTAIAKQTALIEQLTLRKRGLMQQLLTGKKRLKEFEGEWEEVRLGEICPMERGEMLTSDNYLQGNIPVIAGGKEPAGFHSYANRQKNTITISCSGASAGFVAFHDVPIFATDCFTISESNAYNVWFIYHVLTNLQEKIYKLQTGGAQPHVHPKDVYPMKIHIPSINEQNVIASVLVNADKEIEIQTQKLAAMQEQKKGLMQVLLTGKKRIKKMEE